MASRALYRYYSLSMKKEEKIKRIFVDIKTNKKKWMENRNRNWALILL
jgi:hypothetical protein